MTDTRIVLLALSPRAAEVVDLYLTDARANIGPEVAAGDEGCVEDARILELVLSELNSQRGANPPAPTTVAPSKPLAHDIAEQMAAAGATAITGERPCP
jgi:hypothetical protein